MLGTNPFVQHPLVPHRTTKVGSERLAKFTCLNFFKNIKKTQINDITLVTLLLSAVASNLIAMACLQQKHDNKTSQCTFVAGTALCEPECAIFVVGAALGGPRCADFLASAAFCES